MKTTRKLMDSRSLARDARGRSAALELLQQPLLDHASLQRADDLVDEQDSVEMVNLVLQDAGLKSLDRHLDFVAVRSDSLDVDAEGALDHLADVGNRETAFLELI